MRKLTNIILIFVILASFWMLSSCMNFDKEGGGAVPQVINAIETNDVVCHDPSIFYDEVSKKYYAFGSHFAVVSSSDLINWKQENPEYDATLLFGTKDFRSVIPQSDVFAGRDGNINSTWAPDVIKHGDTYYMYFALTSAFGKGKSCISRLSSKNILGPYSGEELLICSNDNYWEEPNAIDPELFYDKNGKLWMVYGSYFAGIYIKELHNSGENFGLPIEDGFGKKIWWGGYSTGVEGPYVFYSTETDYYYLMVSEGNLMFNYSMRIARSKNPNGPYVDVMGNDMVLTSVGKGNKISGNYKYIRENLGQAALGHNSVIKKDGEYYCIYHARSGYGSTIYQNYTMKVSKLILNEDGWFTLAPNEYKGEKERQIDRREISGYEWDIIIHFQDTIQDFAKDMRYVFSESGAIILDHRKVGRYKLKGNFIEIKIDDVTYKGKVVENYVSYQNKVNLSITAVSTSGVPLMANRVLI